MRICHMRRVAVEGQMKRKVRSSENCSHVSEFAPTRMLVSSKIQTVRQRLLRQNALLQHFCLRRYMARRLTTVPATVA